MAAKRLLRDLKGTMKFVVLPSKSQSLALTIYIDVDWASSIDDKRSIGGRCVYMGDSLISWNSGKYKVVSWSFTEAEFHYLAFGITELLWIQQILTALLVILFRILFYILVINMLIWTFISYWKRNF